MEYKTETTRFEMTDENGVIFLEGVIDRLQKEVGKLKKENFALEVVLESNAIKQRELVEEIKRLEYRGEENE